MTEERFGAFVRNSKARSIRASVISGNLTPPSDVILGLEPRINRRARKVDGRVKPAMTEERFGAFVRNSKARSIPASVISGNLTPPSDVILGLEPGIHRPAHGGG
ncbi:hypothetical protein K0P19_08810 [Shinella sp. YE25]|uniref:hypothetical protein n=1 Tax=Shinella sp. YE25 TaxID=2862958 RepID=UPI00234F4911|nr:hypothetical protein [Shinella sp. YE25]MDC7254833.1 hypothetical protein [Shinella sp. YE25]